MIPPYAPVDFLKLVPTLLFGGAALYGMLGLYAWRRKADALLSPFIGLMLSMGWWSLGYGLEVASWDFPIKLFWVKVQYFGVVAIPLLWLRFALKYARRESWLTLQNRVLLGIVPVITLILVWTNDLHHLMWGAVQITEFGSLTLLDIERGWFFWVSAAYSYILILAGSVILTLAAMRSPRLYRSQAIAILVAVFAPLLGNILYLFHLLPIEQVDLTSLFFLPSGISLSWAITRYQLLQIIPPAQDAILRGLRDGIVMLDSRQRVIYMNRAAGEILHQNADQALGLPVELACGECSPQILPRLAKEKQHLELVLAGNGEACHYEVDITPGYLPGHERSSQALSHLIIFHDISERTRAETELHRRESILHAVGLASELFLKSAAWERNVEQVLERLGEAAEVSRVYIFEHDFSETGVSLVSQRYEWTRAGIAPQIDNPDLQNLEWGAAGFARWEETFEKRGAISGPVREFPESEREFLAAQDILSLVVMPVFVEEGWWGFIGFDECVRERTWSEPELAALRAAADIFGAALTRGNVEKRLLKRQHSQELMQEIIRAALGRNNIEELGQFLVDHLGILINADHCFLSLWDELKNRIVPVAAYGANSEIYRNMVVQPGEKTFTASVLETGRRLVVYDAQDSPYVSARIAALFGTRSVLAIPMISNAKKLGAVLLGFIQPHRFTTEEIAISEQAADLVAIALAKFQAVAESHRRAEESETLRRAWVAISETLNLQDTITRLLEQLAFVLPHDSASVQLLRGGELEIVGGEGWENLSAIIGLRFSITANNPNRFVILTHKPYLVNDTYESFPIFRATEHASHIRSWLGAPLVVHGKIIGLLAIDSREPFHFTPDDVDLAAAFAGQVAVAIENARLFDEVQRLAVTDGLTGLFNRRYFLERAEIEFQRSRRYKRDLSAMIFDIDHFKQVNDNYGHPIGDQVLQAVAALCAEKLREADPVGRYGGEEFVALIVETSPDNALKAGERMRREIENMIVHTEKGDIKITASIGIAGLNELTPNLETLINRADQAMYVAKHKGRNRVVIGK